MNVYEAELRVPQHPVSFHAVQRFIASTCESLAVPPKVRLDVELAIEEGMIQLFSRTRAQNEGQLVRIKLQFESDAIRITVLAPGRPLDVQRLPVYSPTAAKEGLDGIETFLIRSVVDAIHWRYVEKEGQELAMTKLLPSPIAEQHTLALPGEASEMAPVGEIACRGLATEEEAFAVSVCAYDIYRYAYKDVIYYPQELLARNRSGQTKSWIAIDEAGTVFGHYALMKKKPEDRIAEMGAAFVRPECRKGGIFQRLCEVAHEEAHAMPLAGLFSLSVTNHLSTQKSSERVGRRTVGLRLGSSPAIFVEGAKPGDRITTALNYRQLAPRAPRALYLPDRYRNQILASYGWLGIPIDAEGVPSAEAHPGHATCDRDLTWNRAVIDVAGGVEAAHKLRAYTELLVEQGVACIMLSIDLDDPGAPMLADEAVSLGFFYSGILPESLKGGHDALQLQMLNGFTLNPDDIQLHMPSAKEIMGWIRAEAPHVFGAVS